MKKILNQGSLLFFGNEVGFKCFGVSIPFIKYFNSKYPECDVLYTGVYGNDGNEHGPNENLNLELCKKTILIFCYLLPEF